MSTSNESLHYSSVSMKPVTENIKESKSFYKHMTTFDNKMKVEVFNLFQYSLMMIIPILILNMSIHELFSTDIENKSAAELFLEVFAELFVLLSGIYIIHRVITYIPTYSEEPYSPINFITFSSLFIFILFSFQTNINEKAKVIFQKVLDLFNLNSSKVNDPVQVTNNPNIKQSHNQSMNANNGQNVRVTQPISGGVSGSHSNPPYLQKQTMYQSNPVNNVPIHQQHQQNIPPVQPQQPQQPDVVSSLHGMNSQSSGMDFNSFHEPMAANDAFGSSISMF